MFFYTFEAWWKGVGRVRSLGDKGEGCYNKIRETAEKINRTS